MKTLLTILSFLFFLNARSQYVYHWEVGDQSTVAYYEIQQSLNNKDWVTLWKVTPMPQTTTYNDTINVFLNNYYRLSIITKDTTYTTQSILVYDVLPVIIADSRFRHIKVKIE